MAADEWLERTRQALSQHGLAPEDWGGDTIVAGVSARTGEGIEHLLEMILLQADVLELKANPKAEASGVTPRPPKDLPASVR